VGNAISKPTIFVFQLGNLLVFLILSYLCLFSGSCLTFSCQCFTDDIELCQDLLLENLQIGMLLACNFVMQNVLFSSSVVKLLTGSGSINYLLLFDIKIC
jgi:hypothetical protein